MDSADNSTPSPNKVVRQVTPDPEFPEVPRPEVLYQSELASARATYQARIAIAKAEREEARKVMEAAEQKRRENEEAARKEKEAADERRKEAARKARELERAKAGRAVSASVASGSGSLSPVVRQRLVLEIPRKASVRVSFFF
jgi:translation initiation factor IF-2